MKKKMILHISLKEDKFIIPFIKWVNNNFCQEEHVFILLNKKKQVNNSLRDYSNIICVGSISDLKKLFIYAYRADKIILHSLVVKELEWFLFCNFKLLSKCYWVIWGGDLYNVKRRGLNKHIRNFVIKHIGHIITYIKEDYIFAQKLYKTKAQYHECLMYPSNLYKLPDKILAKKEIKEYNILIGNSASDDNNHLEILQKLSKYRNQNIKLYCPLSYGDKDYANRVIIEGKRMFGNRFIPLMTFKESNNYTNFLSMIDIACFAHDRQEGMGTIITLLGLGKTVYMKPTTTSYQFFDRIGIKVFDIGTFRIKLISSKDKYRNIYKIKKYFSHEVLLSQWRKIFSN